MDEVLAKAVGMRILKKKHLFLLPLLLFTFLIYSMKTDEPALTHGYIIVSPEADYLLPAVQMSFYTTQQNLDETLEIGPASLYRSCTIFTRVESAQGVDAGIALLNPEGIPVNVQIQLKDPRGNPVCAIPAIEIPGFGKTARLLSEWLNGSGQLSFDGQIQIQSDHPVAVMGLQLTSGVIRNIPVLASQQNDTRETGGEYYFPHYATGGGYRCSLTLWNPHSRKIGCRVKFYDAGGKPSPVAVGGQPKQAVEIFLEPGSSREIPLETVQH